MQNAHLLDPVCPENSSFKATHVCMMLHHLLYSCRNLATCKQRPAAKALLCNNSDGETASYFFRTHGVATSKNLQHRLHEKTGGASCGGKEGVSNGWISSSFCTGFLIIYQSPRAESRRSHGRGRAFSCEHASAGVHIWVSTSLTGGPIHIKPIGRNPLGGNVGTDSHWARCSPTFASSSVV